MVDGEPEKQAGQWTGCPASGDCGDGDGRAEIQRVPVWCGGRAYRIDSNRLWRDRPGTRGDNDAAGRVAGQAT